MKFKDVKVGQRFVWWEATWIRTDDVFGADSDRRNGACIIGNDLFAGGSVAYFYDDNQVEASDD